MITEYQLRLLPEQAADEARIKQYIAQEKGLDIRTLNTVRVLKRSIDARRRTIYVGTFSKYHKNSQLIHA